MSSPEKNRHDKRQRVTIGLSMATTLLALVAFTGNARADFDRIQRVFNGSAYTMDEGEFAVGIFSPIQYGLLDELTVATHPVLDLLLTPNLSLRYKPVDTRYAALAFTASYIQTFLDRSEVPGSVSLFPTLTIPATDRVSLSLQAGYVLEVDPLSHGLLYGANIGLLMTSADLLWLGVQGQYHPDGRGADFPTIMITYSHAWDVLRVSVGLAIGSFPTQIGTTSSDALNLPVYPIVDVWWLM